MQIKYSNVYIVTYVTFFLFYFYNELFYRYIKVIINHYFSV